MVEQRQHHHTSVWQAVLLLITFAAVVAISLSTQTAPSQFIGRDTARWVTEYAEIGTGWISQGRWSPDGKTVALAGSLGVWLYDAYDFDAPPRLLDGHASVVHSIAYHPTRPLLVSGAEDGTLALWNLETGDRLALVQKHEWHISRLLFSPDGTILISSGDDRILAVWDVVGDDLSLRFRIQFDQFSSAVAFHPTRNWFAVAFTNRQILVYDTQLGTLITEILVPDGTYGSNIAFGLDGTSLFGGQSHGSNLDGIGAIWEIEDSQFRLSDLTSYDGNLDPATVAYFMYFADIELASTYTLQTRVQLHRIKRQSISSQNYWDISPDGTQMVYRDSEKWMIWDLTRQVLVKSLFNLIYTNGTIAVRGDGEQVASTSGYLSSVADGAVPAVQIPLVGMEVFYADDTPFVILKNRTAPFLARIQIWNMSSGELVAELPELEDTFSHVVLSPDHRLMAVTGRGISIWEMQISREAAQVTHLLKIENMEYLGHDAIFASDSESLYTLLFNPECNCNNIYQWNIHDGTLIQRIDFPVGSGILAQSLSGDLLAYGGTRADLHMYNRVTEAQETLFDPQIESGSIITDIAFNPQEDTLAAASSSGALNLLRLADHEVVLSLGVDSATSAHTIAFSPDGTVVAVGTSSGRILLVDSFNGLILNTLDGHKGYISSVHFSSDGTTLATTGRDATVRLWRVGNHLAPQVSQDQVLVSTRTPEPTLPLIEEEPILIPIFVPSPTPVAQG